MSILGFSTTDKWRALLSYTRINIHSRKSQLEDSWKKAFIYTFNIKVITSSKNWCLGYSQQHVRMLIVTDKKYKRN